ncbi:unnamed protein product [Cuscuta epithymum]|uniref:Uncharacterized protein n=1 Tax=Cuscuta epithymum TaxID=186058 RepID=A0AAV0BWU7_9ASTE|nr:unnamed protein product [Cuscuta epithymum]
MSDDDGDDHDHNHDRHGGGGGCQRDIEGKKIIELADNDAVIGGWAEEFKSFMGKMVRSRVSINTDSWKKVSKKTKDQIFKEIQHDYAVDDMMKKPILKRLGKMHKDWRNRLRSGFIHMTRQLGKDCGEAYEKYKDQFTKEEWDEFVTKTMTPEFVALSEKNRLAALKNIYPHHMGRSGYVLSIPKWKEQGLLDKFVTSSDVDSTNSSTVITDDIPRHVTWFCARSGLTADGQLVFPGNTEGMLEKKEKLDKVKEDLAAGTWKPTGRNDILAEVVGKPDYPGRARGVGGGVGYTHVFDREPRSRPKVGNLSDAQLKQLQELLMKDMQNHFVSKGEVPTGDSMPASEAAQADTMNSVAPLRKRSFIDGVSCKLAIESHIHSGDKSFDFVAVGVAYNTSVGAVIHNVPMCKTPSK